MQTFLASNFSATGRIDHIYTEICIGDIQEKYWKYTVTSPPNNLRGLQKRAGLLAANNTATTSKV